MKKLTLLLLFALLAILGRAEPQKYQVHYTVNISGRCDSTALYQRVETKNAAEPYTLGDVVCYLHNGSKMVAEREYGLYENGNEFFLKGLDDYLAFQQRGIKPVIVKH